MNDNLIYHITSREDWQASQADGEYQTRFLEREGFIHASTREEIVETADLLFAGRDDLVLLCIDPSLLAAPLRREEPSGAVHRDGAGLFPHIYGPLNLDAVTQVMDFPCNPDGTFELPAELPG